MAWIFQGNPQRFDIDDYISRYPELIYWRTPRHQSEVSIGDRAFVWRAGSDAGVVAIGTVVEAPTPGVNVKHPEALGADLWHAEEPNPIEPRTGIHLDEVRITEEERYLPRSLLKQHATFAQATIITMPNGTIFPLNAEQAQVIEQHWGFSSIERSYSHPGTAEGERTLRSHYRRERSVSLRDKKLKQVREREGK